MSASHLDHRFAARVNRQTIDALEKIAELQQRSVSAVVRRLLEQALQHAANQ